MKIFEPGKKSFTLFVIVISMILLAGIPAVSAVYTATLDSPTWTYPGDTVTLTITGLANTNTFTVQMKSTNLATSGGTVTFSNFVMPFGFTTGTATTTLVTTGIPGTTTLSVKDAGSTTYTKTGSGSPNTITSNKDITAQTYQTISIAGTPSGSTVGIDYTVGGTSVTGTVTPATLTFALNGINTGDLQIIVNDGSSDVLDTNVHIAVRPTPTPTQASSEGGGPSSPSAPAAVVAPVAPVVVAPVVAIASLTTSTVTTGAGGTIAGSPSVNVGSGTVSFSPGTTVTTGAGNPVTSLGMGGFNIVTTTQSVTVPSFSFVNGHVVRTQHTFTYNVYTVA